MKVSPVNTAVQDGCFGLTGQELELVKMIVDMGGAVFIAVLIILALAFLTWKLGGRVVLLGGQIVSVMQNQADATGRQADALTGQAQAMSEMKDALNQYILKDNNEHREILLGVEVLAREMKELTSAVSELKHDKDGSGQT